MLLWGREDKVLDYWRSYLEFNKVKRGKKGGQKKDFIEAHFSITELGAISYLNHTFKVTH